MKTVWLTSLDRSEEKVAALAARLKTYGLEVRGHFWVDELEKAAWSSAREDLMKPEVACWLILVPGGGLDAPSVRYGLALLAATVQARRGVSFPIVLLPPDGRALPADALPTPLKGAEVFSPADAGLPAKLVALAHTPPAAIPSDYHLDAYGNPQIGQWFEVGPRQGSWPGALLGVPEGEIAFHAVGPRGSLPATSTLNFPMKGLKLSLGGVEYTAWAVRNDLDPEASYFVKVTGFPPSIVFGPLPAGEEADLYAVRLK